eukprot:CAMPEP_0194445730 /NCGR_PEP_ID=MMETSP0176-20130528/128027_1 /TAXON_ID=216777 /ORGANISM="Proboscia alata, Strain PI-D3" /LENGTH=1394 /DNA_ID=CAMNT_0039272333 /DNA_START=36 /DNA_END=4217 /DNA_ORIENTATION=-
MSKQLSVRKSLSPKLTLPSGVKPIVEEKRIQLSIPLYEAREKTKAKAKRLPPHITEKLFQYTDGTRGWMFKEFERWFNAEVADSRIFCLFGSGGTGKTMISAKIAAAEENNGDCIMAWHFCRHDNTSDNTITKIIYSIVSSVKETLKEYETYLEGNDLEKESKSIRDPKDLFNALLATPLSKICPPKDSFKKLIIIDALDELSRESLLDILEIIKACFPNLPNWVVFFITARREQKIVNALLKSNVNHHEIELTNENHLVDMRAFFHKVIRKFADTSFSFDALEQNVELHFGMEKNSLRGKLTSLDGPMNTSRKAYDDALAIIISNEPRFSRIVQMIPMILNKELRQDSDNLNTLFEQSKVTQVDLGKILIKMFGEGTLNGNTITEGAVVPKEVKGQKRVNEKIRDKYDGDCRQVHDFSRFSTVFRNISSLKTGFEQVRNHELIDMVNIKNKFVDRDVLGYCDINTKVKYKLPDNSHHICEIQFHLQSILEVKEQQHGQYEYIRRRIPNLIKGSESNIDVRKFTEYILDLIRSSPIDAMIEKAMSLSNGNFQYARLTELELEARREINPDRKATFDDFVKLPCGLGSMYETNLDRIFGSKNKGRINWDKCREFISIVCCAREPLPERIMQTVLGQEKFESVYAELSILFPIGSNHKITVLHKSIVDWFCGSLGGDESSKTSVYRITPSDIKKANAELGMVCSELMIHSPLIEKGCIDENTDSSVCSFSFLTKAFGKIFNSNDINDPFSSINIGDESNDTGIVRIQHDKEVVSYAWKHAVYHLKMGESCNKLLALRKNLVTFEWLLRKTVLVDPYEAIVDLNMLLEVCVGDRVIELLIHALQLMTEALYKNPLEMASQFVGGRLTMAYENQEYPEIIAVREAAMQWLLISKNNSESNVAGGLNGACCWRPITQFLPPAGNPSKSILKGHVGRVNCVKFDTTGNYIVSGGGDSTVQKWNVATGRCIEVMKGHTSSVWCVDINHDGSTIWSGGADNSIRGWDAETGSQQLIMNGHERIVLSVKISLDGCTLCSGSYDNSVRLWNASTGEQKQIMNGHSGRVFSVDMSADALRVYSGSSDHTIKEWDTRSGECLRTLSGHTDWVRSIFLGANDKQLFSASYDHTVGVWNLDSGELECQMEGHTHNAESVCASPDGKHVVSCSWDNSVKVWDPSSGVCVNTLEGHTNVVTSVYASSSSVCSCSCDGTMRLWDLKAKAIVQSNEGHHSNIRWLRFNQTGDKLLSYCHGWTYDTKLMKLTSGMDPQYCGGNVQQEKSFLCSCSCDGTMRLWDLKAKAIVQSNEGHHSNIRWTRFNQTGDKLLSYCHGRTLDTKSDKWVFCVDPQYCVWECATGTIVSTSNVEPSAELFDQSTAMEKYQAYDKEHGERWLGDNTQFPEHDIS